MKYRVSFAYIQYEDYVVEANYDDAIMYDYEVATCITNLEKKLSRWIKKTTPSLRRGQKNDKRT